MQTVVEAAESQRFCCHQARFEAFVEAVENLTGFAAVKHASEPVTKLYMTPCCPYILQSSTAEE